MIVADEEADGQLVAEAEQRAFFLEAGSEGFERGFVGKCQEDTSIGDRNVDVIGFDSARGHFDLLSGRAVECGNRIHEQFLSSA